MKRPAVSTAALFLLTLTALTQTTGSLRGRVTGANVTVFDTARALDIRRAL